MLRKLLSIMLSVCILLTAVTATQFMASAEDHDVAATSGGGGDGEYTCGDFTYNLLDDGTASLASYHGDATALEIPSSLDGHTVTALGTFCFAWIETLTSVTMPDTVTTLQDGVFNDCTSLTEINFSNNITSIWSKPYVGTPWYDNQPDGPIYIGKVLFALKGECPTELEIKDGTVYVRDYAFSDCETLTKVKMPDSLKEIGYGSFRGCVNLSEIEFSAGLETVGNGAFYNTAWLTDQPDGLVYIGNYLYAVKGACPAEITIKDGVTEIGDEAFYSCTTLKKITIPASVTHIGEEAFRKCTNLTDIELPENLSEIEYSTFEECKSLKSVNIPASVTRIEPSAFESSGLESIDIPDTVTTVGYCAFAYCSDLSSVKLPSGMTSIDEETFGGCESLKSIEIPASVIEIADNAFESSGLENIDIPAAVTTIGDKAFYNCASLENVEIEGALTDMGEDAFSGTPWYNNQPSGVWYSGNAVLGYFGKCPEEVVIKDGTVKIGRGAFKDQTALKSISLPASFTELGGSVFNGCSSLESIKIDTNNPIYDSRDNCNAIIETATDTLVIGTKGSTVPDGIKTIGEDAFKGSDIEEISIPASVTKIGNYAFSKCKKLKNISVNLDGDLTEIGHDAFEYCTSLDTVWLPYGLKRIESYAFYNCSSLRYIYGTSKLDYIGGGAFSNTLWEASFANNPMNIDKTIYLGAVIYKEVHSNRIGGKICNPYPYTYGIYDRAYYGDKSLIQINIPDGCAYFGARAFMGCTQLKSIEIPASVTRIGEKALGYTTSGDLISGFTIYGYTYSEAERYAEDNNIKFVSIGEAPTEAPTTAPTVVPTEPVTQAPTEPVTLAPTEPATQEPTTAPTLAPVKLGDANGDGEVDSVDATIVQRAATKIQVPYSEEQLMCADIDGDGSLTIVDATFIQRYDSKIAVPYPVGEAK